MSGLSRFRGDFPNRLFGAPSGRPRGTIRGVPSRRRVQKVQEDPFRTDILIVGAGFAGASTAFHLSRGFEGSILIVDQEQVPGFHASGRNASLVLQSTTPPQLRRMAVESRKHYEARAQQLCFRQTGSLLLGSRSLLEPLREPSLVESEYCSPEAVRRDNSILRGHQFETALWTPTDGVIDISLLLNFYLDGARSGGASIRFNCQVESISEGPPFRVDTSAGRIEAGVVVNAAGAWAGRLAHMAGAAAVPLFPLKRHLFVLDGIEPPNPDGAFVWSMSRDFYYRPESGGLLFSVCDEEPSRSLEPTVNSEIAEMLAEVIWRELPALQDAVQRRVWSCFRTKTLDDQFVIGWDPQRSGFFWVAGLGGHGMGTSWEVGRCAARAILNRDEAPIPDAFQPARHAALTPAGVLAKGDL